MKLLLDTCISSKTRDALLQLGHDVVWTGDWGNDPGDEAILQYAYEENRILVTLDKDFGEIAIVLKRHHSGIIRLAELSVNQQAAVCKQVLAQYADELLKSAIVTASIDRVRIRPAASEID